MMQQIAARKATLVILGSMIEALDAVAAHGITEGTSVVEMGTGAHVDEVVAALTRVTLDGERYSGVITSWLNEPVSQPIKPGTLLRVKWS